ncbi:MAG: CpaE family protein [Planctomycetota bacterium]
MLPIFTPSWNNSLAPGVRRVLVSADDGDFRGCLAEQLEQYGFLVPNAARVCWQMMADAASRMGWDLIVCVLPSSIEVGRRLLQTARHSCSAPILAIGRATDPHVILQALRDGADEYVDIADWSRDLFESVQRVLERTRRHAGSELTGHVVSVLGAAGGVGTTSITANLGAWLAQSACQSELEELEIESMADETVAARVVVSTNSPGRAQELSPQISHSAQWESCAVYDLHRNRNDLASFYALESEFSLADFCRTDGPIDRARFDRLFTRHASGVDLLAAPTLAEDSLLVTPQGLRLALALGRGKYGYQLLDVDARDSALRDEALWQADLVLLVIRLDLLAIRAAKRWLDSWEEEGFPLERVRVIANRVGQPREIPLLEAHESLGTPIWHQVVDDVRRANQAINQGRLPVLRSRWWTLCRNLQSLTDHVRQELPVRR